MVCKNKFILTGTNKSQMANIQVRQIGGLFLQAFVFVFCLGCVCVEG